MNRLIFRPTDFDWLLSEAGIGPDTQARRAMQRRHVEDQSDQAIAAELGITVSAVRSHISRGWRLIRRYLQQPGRAEHLRRVFEEAQAACSERRNTYLQQGRQLLGAMEGPRRPDPETPTLDEAGRPVGNHDRLVDVHDAAEIIARAEAMRREREARGWG